MDVENRVAREVRLVGHTSHVPLICRRGSVSIAALALLSLAVGVLVAVRVYPTQAGKAALAESAQGGLTDQPDSSVTLVNECRDPLTVYVEYANRALAPPPQPWIKLSGEGSLGQPEAYGPHGVHPANDVGAATWQLVTLSPGQSIVLQIPNFPRRQAWSLRPLKYINGKPCTGAPGDCGMPILVESGKDMVGDMSAVDGVNYKLKYEMTARGGYTTIDMKSNPCRAINAPSSKGCRNPQVDIPDWRDPPCPAGTCHNTGKSKIWCDTIHEGQCANSASTWSSAGQGYKDCAPKNQFTTYCYSHDDANSSPTFSAPYKMRLTYSDLDS